MVVVPPAKVWVGQRECAVEAYALAAHPVTEAEYERYVSATEVAPPEHWRGRKPPVGRARHPVVGVSLEEARQYARWSGLRLPTEAEWTSAVRGAEGRSYPWGEACGEGKTCQCSVVGADGPASVDAHAAGSTPDGVADLLGNVWEWVEAGSGALSLESGHGVALGGSYRHPCTRPGQIPRTEMQVTKRYQYLGFRVASSLVAP
jgi:formylglycine-generating enzyme required for sulfatase activity